MTINALAEQLIHDLRFDPHTREHFRLTSWWGQGTCETVGCIAGTAVSRAYGVRWLRGETSWMGKLPNGKPFNSYRSSGMRALGLPTMSVAGQLFTPWSDWQWPLIAADIAHVDFIAVLSDNERPSLDTVAKMVAWAKNLPKNAWHPTHCANALENVLKHERLYVDWAEAWCEP